MIEIFKNRKEAGEKLAAEIAQIIDDDYIILGLPRGGIPVAYEIAKALKMQLDVFLVTKIGCPGHEEFAIGAATVDGSYILDESTINRLNIPAELIAKSIKRAQEKLKKRDDLYRKYRPAINLKNKNIILVDDGIATGATASMALDVLKKQGVNKIIIAAPTCSKSAYDELAKKVTKIICIIVKENFKAVGEYYENFSQTEDEEVINFLLQKI